ncbi:E3 ubiquitin--protein ligase [Bradyrhizobium japonicum]|uniref:E3 ubiquitin--protein ligase n=4 Tax=Nitrobacteraceae TaxID=41294 RepID=A0A0A3XF75_BRAJP|nr:E3 ubiquitin--protein ligase [Bradyrhizobium japonicum]MBR1367856.1 E3 ubiquitin--protein ligase [Bradyrhizobium ottawaense]APG14840.1 E3 ubiquitin--protein ligase [Bradyrhizobium japonicum]KGT73042.1 E3 ubiquitin--protein ligase [Bradyrhizobium japonicum]MYV88206.1 E3 ubiquitin--protein ligase [Bradyrhizobium japonicum]
MEILMNTGQAQWSAGSSSAASEEGEQESYLSGFSRAVADLLEAMTGYRTPASARAQLLDNWAAEEGQGEAENRRQGRARIRGADNTGSHSLDLSSLSLTALPAALPPRLLELRARHNELSSLPASFPPGLQHLLISHNRLISLPDALPATLSRLEVADNSLTSLPANLPAGLEILNASDNRLTSLPDALPSRLTSLAVSGNQLTDLPDYLPSGLIELDVSSNQLADLPAPLPSTLQSLNLSGNRLTSLPEDLLEGRVPNLSLSYPHLENLEFGDNPLPDDVLANLATAEAPPQLAQQSLYEAAAQWLADDPATLAKWQHFADEPGAQDYAQFLERLRETVNYGNDEFRQAVADDLQQAAANPTLREQFFAQASEANASCEDRVTLHWNGMQTARLNADVEDGVYDDRLGDLIQRGRVAFRLEALDEIARDRINSLASGNPNVDDIEVYLAYQHRLREPLELSHVAPDMRFLAVSHVSEDDATEALDLVREREASQFTDFMASRWHPWETVLRRIAPDEHAAMQDRLVEAMGEEFQSRLDQRLAEHGLVGDVDAERVLGAQVRNQIAGEIKGEVMHRLLAERGLEQ